MEIKFVRALKRNTCIFLGKFMLYSFNYLCPIITSGGMPGLQNIMKQLQQGAAGGLGNLMGGFGGKS